MMSDSDYARQAATDLVKFSEYCFSFPYVNKDFHEKWYRTIEDYNNKSGLIIAPRNSAKSTCWAKVAPLYLLGRNPDLRIVLISRTSTLAQTNLRFLRLQIESNDRLHEVFPYREVRGKVYGLKPSSPWGTEMITVENNRRDGVPSVYAVGLEGSISGIRADLIIVDDLIDQNNVMTEGQREKVNSFWDTVVMPTLNPDGRIFAVGTRYNDKDFYARLMDDPMYSDNMFWFPAIKLDDKGEYLRDSDGNMQSYWPERWPISKLLEMKERMGSLAFNSQYMGDPSGYGGNIFDPEHIQFYNPLKRLLPIWGDLDFVMSIDPNVTASPDSDNTVIVTGAVDRKRGTVYVLDMYAKPLDFVEQVKMLTMYGTRSQVSVGTHRFESEVRISKIGVESVAYQRSLQQTGYLAGLPVVEMKQHNRDKEIRILGLQPHIENGRVLFPDPDILHIDWWEPFYEEYCTFPKGRRDDRLDALEILVTMFTNTYGVSGIPYGPSDNYVNRLLEAPGRLLR